MSSPGHDPQDDALPQHEAAADQYVRAVFRVEPVADRSGLFTGERPTSGEPDEEEQFAAYMRRYFPSRLVAG